MKIGTPANYYVRVRPSSWEDTPEREHLHRGSYAVTLNMLLTIAFIDDLSPLGPPWREDTLPPEDDGDLVDPDMVRLLELLQSSYVVTPNETLAGKVEEFHRPWGFEDRTRGVVFYTGRAEFAPLLDDLAALADTPAGNVHSVVRRDAVLDHPAIRFIEDNVLTSPLLHPDDADSAGLTQP
jgi:hypothetical protein